MNKKIIKLKGKLSSIESNILLFYFIDDNDMDLVKTLIYNINYKKPFNITQGWFKVSFDLNPQIDFKSLINKSLNMTITIKSYNFKSICGFKFLLNDFNLLY